MKQKKKKIKNKSKYFPHKIQIDFKASFFRSSHDNVRIRFQKQNKTKNTTKIKLFIFHKIQNKNYCIRTIMVWPKFEFRIQECKCVLFCIFVPRIFTCRSSYSCRLPLPVLTWCCCGETWWNVHFNESEQSESMKVRDGK